MTNEEFDEMMLAPNCTDCNGLTADDDGEWKCAFQGKRTTEDCYGTDYCCMLYLIQKSEEDEEDDDEEDRDYCEEADGVCEDCEIADYCDYADESDDDEDDDLWKCDCEECKPVVKEEVKPVESEMGGTI